MWIPKTFATPSQIYRSSSPQRVVWDFCGGATSQRKMGDGLSRGQDIYATSCVKSLFRVYRGFLRFAGPSPFSAEIIFQQQSGFIGPFFAWDTLFVVPFCIHIVLPDPRLLLFNTSMWEVDTGLPQGDVKILNTVVCATQLHKSVVSMFLV